MVMRTIGLGLALAAFAAVAAGRHARAEELPCSEYSVVTFQLLHGAPSHQAHAMMMGENNQRNGWWSANGNRAMVVCGFLYKASRPVVDVVPDAPKEGEALECRIVAPAEDVQGKVIEKYTYQWKRREGDKWVPAEVPAEPKLAAGVTKEGERWACHVEAVAEDGPTSEGEYGDEIEIGKEKAGDSRANDPWGWTYGQWFHNRGYLKFDISSLNGKKIKAAKLRLFCDVAFPPFKLLAYPSSTEWKEREITWLNQPLKFPADVKPIGEVMLDYGPEPTPENPESPGDWLYSHSPKGGAKRAPDWREIDIAEFVRKVAGAGEEQISICLACESQSIQDHKRVIVFNDKLVGPKDKDRGDMRPRLAVETE